MVKKDKYKGVEITKSESIRGGYVYSISVGNMTLRRAEKLIKNLKEDESLAYNMIKEKVNKERKEKLTKLELNDER